MLQGYKVVSKGVRRVIGRIRVSYGQRERMSSAFRGTMLGRRMMKQNRTTRHQVCFPQFFHVVLTLCSLGSLECACTLIHGTYYQNMCELSVCEGAQSVECA